MIHKKKDTITYDVKAKMNSGKYIFVEDLIPTIEAAKSIADNVIKKDKQSLIMHTEIWETKNNITTNFLLKRI